MTGHGFHLFGHQSGPVGSLARRTSRSLIGATVLLLGCAPGSMAQVGNDSLARRGAYIELGGPGELYSLNYEHIVGRRGMARIGLSRWGFTNLVHEHRSATKAIVGATRLIDLSHLPGQRGSWIEVGATASAGRRSYRDENTTATGRWLAANGIAGLRIQTPGRGMYFRALYSPFWVMNNVEYLPPKGFSHAFAASLGWAY